MLAVFLTAGRAGPRCFPPSPSPVARLLSPARSVRAVRLRATLHQLAPRDRRPAAHRWDLADGAMSALARFLAFYAALVRGIRRRLTVLAGASAAGRAAARSARRGAGGRDRGPLGGRADRRPGGGLDRPRPARAAALTAAAAAVAAVLCLGPRRGAAGAGQPDPHHRAVQDQAHDVLAGQIALAPGPPNRCAPCATSGSPRPCPPCHGTGLPRRA